MNAQMLKRLAGALVALLVIWGAAGLVRRSGRDADVGLAAAKFDPASVDRLTIARPGDTLIFVRQGSQWRVNGRLANAEFVTASLKALADSSAMSELVAQEASSHAQLGLDSAAARRVTAMRGAQRLGDLLVGKRGDAYGTVFVRRPGEVAAYSVRSGLADIVDRTQDDWRDKQIARIQPDSVVSLEVHRGPRNYMLTREGKSWIVSGAPADSSAVAGLLNLLRSLDASGFATKAQAESAFVARPARYVRVLGSSGRELLALTLDSTANGFWVRRDGDSTVFRLDGWVANQLAPSDSALRKK